MKFTIRLDDVGWNPDKSKDAGLRFAQRFHETMAGVPYLAAIIPGCLDDAGRAWLQSEPPGMTVAMHGWLHRPAHESEASEFVGLHFRTCLQILKDAKKMLGVSTRHFVAPWNHYTELLHDALAMTGFDRRWLGPAAPGKQQGPSKANYTRIPCWRPLCGAFGWKMGPEDRPLLDVIPKLIELPDQAVICLHITWEGSKGDDFRGVREFVQRYGNSVIAPEEYLSLK